MWSAVFIGLLGVLTPLTYSQDLCRNPQGKSGTCINIKSCPTLLDLLKSSSQDSKVRSFLRSSICGYEGKDPRVCCPSETSIDNNDHNRTAAANSMYGPLQPPQCGFSNATLRRIVGGEPAALGAWPWITALGYKNWRNPNVPNWLCGGVLISSRHVLTAAHCVYDAEDSLYKVRIGDLDLKNDNDGATPFEDFILRKTIHPLYNPTEITNDIAILKTTREVPFSSMLHPICLPVDEYNRNRDLENTFPFIAGWGTTYFKGPASNRLLQTQVPIRTEQECKHAYRNLRDSVIDDRVLCAGYLRGGKDSCQGDSGGPMMSPDPRNRMYYTFGIVSYGYKCAEPGYPGVYTKVTAFLDFIMSHLN